ncbi:hypothetical protein Y032_0356g3365 [Ancylostoma ceylanicum]|uniref:Uncharacterized protein n=1 Tax=Ancylostoma ceylanicum TaxID=53326 RepID=A0A016RWD7_9BILA|nr:hypothetical protein Y032_0356g3365 [Ancylostoma ceylanicum]
MNKVLLYFSATKVLITNIILPLHGIINVIDHFDCFQDWKALRVSLETCMPEFSKVLVTNMIKISHEKVGMMEETPAKSRSTPPYRKKSEGNQRNRDFQSSDNIRDQHLQKPLCNFPEKSER